MYQHRNIVDLLEEEKVGEWKKKNSQRRSREANQ